MTNYETSQPQPRAILVGIALPKDSESVIRESLVELGRLVTTLGLDVAATVLQRRPSLSGPTVVGKGKLAELAQITGGAGLVVRRAPAKKSKAALKFHPTQEDDDEDDISDAPPELIEGVTTIVFDCELKPSQIANLRSATGVEVLDRTAVIVMIFSRHARTREAKIQVEIARLKYLAPRHREDFRAGGDRMQKAGETPAELERRQTRDRISELRDEILEIQREQAETRTRRADQHCVALVGYTNAGKSSLMRALTGSDVYIADKLFATLDTTVRALSPANIPRILISDTVGFIKKLPHDLVASFRSTLEEAKNAGLLLYVADAADPAWRSQLQVAQEVLRSIGVEDIPSRVVLNKCDQLSAAELEGLTQELPRAILMSAHNSSQVARLRCTIIELVEKNMQQEALFVPYAAQKIAGQLRTQVHILEERHEAEGTLLVVRALPSDLAEIRKSLAAYK